MVSMERVLSFFAPQAVRPLALVSALPLYLAGLSAALLIPMALYAHKGLAPLFAVVALATIGHWFVRRHQLSVTPVFAAMAAFALLAGASAVWSVVPGETLWSVWTFALTLLGGYLSTRFVASLDRIEHPFLTCVIAWGGLFGLAIFAIDIGSQEISELFLTVDRTNSALVDYWNRKKPGLAVAALFLWPWAGAAIRHCGKWLTFAAAALIAVLVLCSGSDAAKLAMVAGALVGACTLVFPRLSTVVLALGVLAVMASSPFLPRFLVDPSTQDARYDTLSQSAIHRIFIWRAAGDSIAERPLLGHGFDGSRALPAAKDRQAITFLPGSARHWSIITEPIPLHPHNLVLQVWLELGAAGATVMAIFFVLLMTLMSRRFCGAGLALGIAALTSALVIGLVSYGAWQSWWLSALMLTSTFTASLVERGSENQRP